MGYSTVFYIEANMRPVSPAPLQTKRRERLLIDVDESDGDGDGTSRSSSLPPRARAAFMPDIPILAPCSKEFQKSLNDLYREKDEVFDAKEKLTLPVIQMLKSSDVKGIDTHNKDRNRLMSCSDEELSCASGNSTSDEDISQGWTTLSQIGTLSTLLPKNGNRKRSENSDKDSGDDTLSIRSDSHLITNRSRRSFAKIRTKSTTEGSESLSGRLSRKDLGAQTLEPPSPHSRTRRLSPLARPHTATNELHRPVSSYQSKSANNSPEQPRRFVFGTGSAPSSPINSPALIRRGNNTIRVPDTPKWQVPFKMSTSSSSHTFSNRQLNPTITAVDMSYEPCTGSGCSRTFGRRVGRVKTDAWRLSDLSPDKHNDSMIDLDDEFKKLRGCRYIRGSSRDDESGSADEK